MCTYLYFVLSIIREIGGGHCYCAGMTPARSGLNSRDTTDGHNCARTLKGYSKGHGFSSIMDHVGSQAIYMYRKRKDGMVGGVILRIRLKSQSLIDCREALASYGVASVRLLVDFIRES